MVTRTDGSDEAQMPAIRTFVQDAAIAAMQGMLANPNTHGTDTAIGPSVTFAAVSLARQLEDELHKGETK